MRRIITVLVFIALLAPQLQLAVDGQTRRQQLKAGIRRAGSSKATAEIRLWLVRVAARV